MQIADINTDDFLDNRQNDLDNTLLVRFYVLEKQDMQATLEQGRPIYKEVEYIDIKTPGNKSSHIQRPATVRDKQRFPKHYSLFQKRISEPTIGTPLSQWTVISRAMAKELEHFNCKTVEQLANMTDGNLQNIPFGNELRRKAIKFLELADVEASKEKEQALRDELAKKDEQIDKLTSSVESLTVKVELLSSCSKPTTAKPTAKKRTTRVKKAE